MQDPQTRGHTPPARCVPTGQLSIPQSSGRGRCHCPSLKLASFLGIHPNQDLFPKRRSTPGPLSFSVSAEQRWGWSQHGHLLHEVLLTTYGHRAQGLGEFTQCRSKGPVVSVQSYHPQVWPSMWVPSACPLPATLLKPRSERPDTEKESNPTCQWMEHGGPAPGGPLPCRRSTNRSYR